MIEATKEAATQPAITHILVPIALFNAVTQYMTQRPYNEVAGVMQALQQQTQGFIMEAPAEPLQTPENSDTVGG